MAIAPSPSIVTNGLVLYYDMGNTKKSWRGFPTTNLNSLTGIGIYNNVPGHVTATLATTGEVYLGAPVYKLTLTPTTATGVSYLTAGNNPGIGVVTGGGGGLANRYTGHSIFFRTTVPMHTNPIYTHYSNIPGWQSSTGYDRTSDGWYRAYVTWYYSATQSDGKYWAINPATATLNNPIVIYWAAPFKEDSNVNTFVSPYVETSRSSTTSLLDMTGNTSLSVDSLTYSTTDGTFSFNGSSNYITAGSVANINNSAGTVEMWVKYNAIDTNKCGIIYGGNNTDTGWLLQNENSASNKLCFLTCRTNGTFPIAALGNAESSALVGTWVHQVGVYDNTTTKLYINGVLKSTATSSVSLIKPATTLYFGNEPGRSYYLNGSIAVAKVYNRALSSAEIFQNFNALRKRFGL